MAAHGACVVGCSDKHPVPHPVPSCPRLHSYVGVRDRVLRSLHSYVWCPARAVGRSIRCTCRRDTVRRGHRSTGRTPHVCQRGPFHWRFGRLCTSVPAPHVAACCTLEHPPSTSSQPQLSPANPSHILSACVCSVV